MTRSARVLVLTDEAAAALGMTPEAFRAWAARRRLRPVDYGGRPGGAYLRRGRRPARWDLDVVYAVHAERRGER